jgi:hypothetical protein
MGEAFDKLAVPDLDSEAIDFRAASESFAHLPDAWMQARLTSEIVAAICLSTRAHRTRLARLVGSGRRGLLDRPGLR